MSWIVFIMLVLASYRLTRLIVFDSITAFIRRPFMDEKFEMNASGQMVASVKHKDGGFHRFMRELLSCYWCVGIWVSVAVTLAYLFVPTIAFPFILILALAGAAGILESFVKG